MKSIRILADPVSLCSAAFRARAEEITVAAAADLNYALQDLADDFTAKTGTQVKLSFGSSGNLFSQIQNGAPFDLFFSADSGYPQKLADAGHVDTLRCALTLWTPGALGAPSGPASFDPQED